MNADGSGQTQVMDTDGAVGGSSWSPDGSQIAYNDDTNGTNEIYTVDVASQVRHRAAHDSHDRWGEHEPALVAGRLEDPLRQQSLRCRGIGRSLRSAGAASPSSS